VQVFGHTLHNPIATSAGIDKHADIPDPLFAMGPSIIEIGGCTPLPQEGNPTPRVFRLPSQNALINRYGLNSEGADHVAMRLRHRVREFAKSLKYGVDETAEQRVLNGEAGVPPGSLKAGKLMAVQIAKNKFTPDSDIAAVTDDYIYCVNALAKYADIIVVNVSSPNTPGLRDLQASAPLTSILTGVVNAVKGIDRKTKPAVMVKVSPDEDMDEQIMGICEAVWESGVDGVIVGNTTKRRPEAVPAGYTLPPKEEQLLLEQGGFSGPHLFEKTVQLVKKYRGPLNARPPPKTNKPTTEEANAKLPPTPAPLSIDPPILAGPSTDASSADPPTSPAAAPTPSDPKVVDKPKVIFATGGITSGKQAQEVLDAGASVTMVYTALVYGGVGTVGRIKEELREENEKRKPKGKKVEDTKTKAEKKIEGTKKKVVKKEKDKAPL
jgi:dihydroorotate dehydrogenase